MKTLITTCGALCLVIPMGIDLPEDVQAEHRLRGGRRQLPGRVQDCKGRDRRSPERWGYRGSRCRADCRQCVLRSQDRGGRSGCSNQSCQTGRGREQFRFSPPVRRPACARPPQGPAAGRTGSLKRRDVGRERVFRPAPQADSRRGLRPAPQLDRRPQSRRQVDRRSTPVPREPDRPARATAIAWRQNADAAADESIETGRPLLMKFSATWCGPCQRMNRETLSDPALARLVNATVIPVDVDIDRASDLARDLRIESVPTILIVSPRGEVLERVAGFQTVRQLEMLLKRADVNAAVRQRPTADLGSAKPDHQNRIRRPDRCDRSPGWMSFFIGRHRSRRQGVN